MDDEEKRAVERVFQSGIFCSVFQEAREVRALEHEFAASVGARHAVAFSSGTTAQHAALVALGIGPGDQVVVPPLTFISTAYTVLLAGAIPVFADVCPDTFTVDPQDIARRITPQTKAVVPVHWLGTPAEMDAITSLAAERGLLIVEDSAHGPGICYRGRQVGSFGRVSCWSMQQSKMLTAAGEGGIATTSDEGVARRLREIRDHGKAVTEKVSSDIIAPYRVTRLGNNYRLSEMHAAFARAQLAKLPMFVERRRKAHARLHQLMSSIPGIVLRSHRPYTEESGYCFPLLFPQDSFSVPIESISSAVFAEGVENYAIGLYELCHFHPLFGEEEGRASAPAFLWSGRSGTPPYGPGSLPKAETVSRELLVLPMHPELSEKDTAEIAEAVNKVVRAYRRDIHAP